MCVCVCVYFVYRTFYSFDVVYVLQLNRYTDTNCA